MSAPSHRSPPSIGKRASTSGVIPSVGPSSGPLSSRGHGGPTAALRPTVLLVDDDAPSLRAFQRVLSRRDVEVLSASTVTEAFGLVAMLEPAPHPMVAFVDVLMPGMDGPKFVHALRSVPAFGRSPVVLVSGLSSQALDKTVEEWGANGYILKSRGLLNLDQEFNSWLDRASQGPPAAPPNSRRY